MLKVVACSAAPDERALVSTEPVKEGQVVGVLATDKVLSAPDRYSVQISEEVHIHGGSQASFLNHSCDPNCRIDPEGLRVVALRDLAAGEELTFFYPSTEWDMAEPFDCRCGAARCLKTVRGARWLSDQELAGRFLCDHIQRLRRSTQVGAPTAILVAV
jgi:hypothetical protein